MKKRILLLVGTRPNFIKITQFKKVILNYSHIELKIVHTGQHFDSNMADVFFKQFQLVPDFFLNISQKSVASQIGAIMMGLEKLINNDFFPDLLIVPGDVNSTLAGALVANKMNIKLAHLESGLRSNDKNMPEEINRILTDQITDYYFVTEESGLKNLEHEKQKGKIYYVGNTMIDTLVAFETEINTSNILIELSLIEQEYVLMTIHRPSNVDTEKGLRKLIALLIALSKNYKIVFPIHPRTIKQMEYFGIKEINELKNLIILKPMGYFEFQKLIKHAKFIITDSGGIQEETTYRRIPCLTLRENTERPITVDMGTNTLVPFDLKIISKFITQIENNQYKEGTIPSLWDGKATERIMEIINSIL
jgi:UDP-N-acetylglucosamine 2-epimerase (non-hydrolysing)